MISKRAGADAVVKSMSLRLFGHSEGSDTYKPQNAESNTSSN